MADHGLTYPLAFAWGVFGSIAVEAAAVVSEMRTEAGVAGVSLYYKQPIYWATRLFFAVVAGGLCIAEEPHTMLVAINLGASAPAILQLLAKPPK